MNTFDALTIQALEEAAVAGLGAAAIVRLHYRQTWTRSLGAGVLAFLFVAALFAPIETHTEKLDLPKTGRF